MNVREVVGGPLPERFTDLAVSLNEQGSMATYAT
jgi:hypothetical protein